MNRLKQIECFVLDMDGTLYLGERVLPGAKELLRFFDDKDIKYFFFTNNSSKSPADYIEKLNKLGLGEYQRNSIITSGDVTANYVIRTFGSGAKVYLAGTPSLREQFEAEGIICTKNETPDCVVIGFDTTFSFEKASEALSLIRKGIPFLATNIDAVCPMDGGEVLPDCASICAMLTHASAKLPKFLGKPSRETADYITDKAGVQLNNIAVVGDRLYTDIRLAADNGMCSIGVLSGEMTQKDINESQIIPDYIFPGVFDLLNELKTRSKK